MFFDVNRSRNHPSVDCLSLLGVILVRGAGDGEAPFFRKGWRIKMLRWSPSSMEAVMLEKGTRIEMTKGYKGVKGRILEETKSGFEFYIIGLDNGIRLVAGPSAFFPLDEKAKP